MLDKCFKILANLLRILTNAVANLTNVLRIKQQHDTCVANWHIHITCLSFFFFLFARLFPISLFPIKVILVFAFFHYTTRISIQMLANLYKRLTITTNALPLVRMAYELLPNMLRICVFTNFRNMFLKFAKSRERPRMYTNTNECKLITMLPLRFVTELPRYYVNDTFRNIFAQV